MLPNSVTYMGEAYAYNAENKLKYHSLVNIKDESLGNQDKHTEAITEHSGESANYENDISDHDYGDEELLEIPLMSEQQLLLPNRCRHHFCNNCGKKYRSKSNLRRHITTRHNQGITCTDCGTVDYNRFKESMCSHDVYRCSRCTKQRLTTAIFGRRAIRRDTEKSLECIICRKTFSLIEKLMKHVLRHKSKPFVSPPCGQTFAYKSTMKRHVLLFHTANKPQYCQLCYVEFACPTLLRAHVVSKHPEKS